MNVLLTLATAKAVSVCTGVLALTSARPLVPSHRVPSGKRIATEMPGIASRSRRRSSRAWSAMRTAVVAVERISDGLAGASTETGPAATGPIAAADGTRIEVTSVAADAATSAARARREVPGRRIRRRADGVGT